MAPHHCRICSAAMSADDGHRECPDCLGAVHVLEDVGNPCSAAVDLSRGERLRRANQVRGHAQGGRAERRRSPLPSPRSRKRGHKHTRRHSEDQQYESPRRSDKEETPRPAKRPAPAEAAGGGSAESRQILAALQALTERLGRLEEQRGPPSLPSGQQGLPLRRPDSQDEQEDEANDVLSLLASQATEDTTGGAGRGGEPRTDSRDESTGVGETPVSSLMSRVLSAANILGLQPPTPDPVPQGGVWDGVSHTSPPPSIPVAGDYTRMLTSSWGRASKRPQFNAGCRQLAMTVYPAETGLGDMPPVEALIASLTPLGPARVSSNPSCPRKECAKTDRLVTRSFNASARAARTGNALAMTLAALRRTLDPADGDAMGLVEAALSAHAQLTRDVGDSMAAAVLCRRQVWLAQTSLPEAIRTELLNLPVTPGHVFHPETQTVLDRTERAVASREAVQRLVTFGTGLFRRQTKVQPEILNLEGDGDRDQQKLWDQDQDRDRDRDRDKDPDQDQDQVQDRDQDQDTDQDPDQTRSRTRTGTRS
ncbi:unnamed protein product [Gadus morhua 'NCC']